MDKVQVKVDQPAICFIPAVNVGVQVAGQYPSFDWQGTINGQPGVLNASATLNQKLLTLGAETGTGAAGKTIYISLNSFTKDGQERKAWYVGSTPPAPRPQQPQPAPQQSPFSSNPQFPQSPPPAPAFAPQPAQLHQANQEKERMIVYQALWKGQDKTKPWIERVKEVVLAEKMLRSINEGISKGTEPTTESVKAMQPSPEIQSLYDTAVNGVEVPF